MVEEGEAGTPDSGQRSVWGRLRLRRMGTGAVSGPDEKVVRRLTPMWAVQLIAILVWYAFNGGTVILNKFLFMDSVGFRFPMTLTLLHLGTGYLLSSLLLTFVMTDIGINPITLEQYSADKLKFAILFVSNIILGNIALKYITVSFMQTVKSMTPFFTTLFQFLIMGTRFTPTAVVSLVPVVFGVMLATAQELSFDLTGFAAAMIGCVVQATQIVYASRLLGDGKMDPFNTVRFIFPPALAGLIPLILLTEASRIVEWARSDKGSPEAIALLALSSTVAFCLNLSTFQLLKVISGVAYSVAGNLKVVVVIVVSIAIFRNPISPVGALGCAITVAGCTWFGLVKNKTVEVLPSKAADDVELEELKTNE